MSLLLRKMTTPCDFDNDLIPRAVNGPFLPISKNEIEIFNDILSDELDSGFASSICCCDYCFEDFKGHWPDVTFREMSFQTQSMGSTWAVDYSRLPSIYAPAEISTLRHMVQCPRCMEFGGCNIWLYEHSFGSSEEFEQVIDELLTLGSATPFLLLEHEFAQRVLREIREQAATSSTLPMSFPLYRARLTESIEKCGQQPNTLAAYGPPPAPNVGEGRFNHAGSPMLYLASSAETAAAEIAAPGQQCCVGRLALRKPLLILDLFNVEEGEDHYELFSVLRNSALLAAPRTDEGWLKRQYVFSRFVADCASSAGFDVIHYGSTKRTDGSNYVFLNPPEDLEDVLSLQGYETVTGVPAMTRF